MKIAASVLRILAALLTLLPLSLTYSAAAAAAPYSYPVREIGNWTVYGMENDCWMRAAFADGTNLSYAWEVTKNETYITINNPKWISIVKGRDYNIRISIDDWSINETAGGV